MSTTDPTLSITPLLTFDYSGLPAADADEAKRAAHRIKSHLQRNIIELGQELVAIKKRLPYGVFCKSLTHKSVQ